MSGPPQGAHLTKIEPHSMIPPKHLELKNLAICDVKIFPAAWCRASLQGVPAVFGIDLVRAWAVNGLATAAYCRASLSNILGTAPRDDPEVIRAGLVAITAIDAAERTAATAERPESGVRAADFRTRAQPGAPVAS